VFHLAAQPLVRESYFDPVGTYSTNVLGTVHVLEAVRKTPSVRAVVVVTTDKCYENHEWEWAYRENDPLGGHDPYSNSKACAELVSAAYRQSFFSPSQTLESGVAIATARAGNVIGGGDWSVDRLLPDVFRAIEAGQPVQVRNPLATRPWQHVLEPLRGYLILAQALVERQPLNANTFNFGPSAEDVWPVGRLVDSICRQFDDKVAWERDKSVHPHEAKALALDISRANRLLGWRPLIDIETAITMTVDWAKGFMAGVDAHHLCLAQIQYYQSLLDRKND
jgi:CDP-glucose 4,6-dehydratase